MQQIFRILIITSLLERILDPTGRLRMELKEEQQKKESENEKRDAKS